APVAIESRDEVGELARAFNAMEDAVVEVAREQSTLLREGVSELYVNLARRNQSLLDRQIRAIDDLERDETDADRLDSLFHVDHLATRMRRNAESLLVLAGSEQVRQWGTPVPVLDVVRSAASEITDYARVDVQGLDGVQVTGAAVIDLTHLLAELLENATSFSPPQSRVVVAGTWYGATYVLSITDEGLGMPEDRLAAANALLADPPAPRLALSRALGLFVVAHLAARVGVTVELRAGSPGVVALVALPASVLYGSLSAPVTAPVTAPVESAPAPLGWAPAPVEPEAWTVFEPAVEAAPRVEPEPQPVVEPEPVIEPEPAVAAPEVAEPVASLDTQPRDETPAGLPRRRPVPGPDLTVERATPVHDDVADVAGAPKTVDAIDVAEPVARPAPEPAPTAPEPAPAMSETAPTMSETVLAPGDDVAPPAVVRSEHAYAADDFLPHVERQPTAPSRASRPPRSRPSFSLRRRQTREPDAWLEPEGWRTDDDDELSWLVPDEGGTAAPGEDESSRATAPVAQPAVAPPAVAPPPPDATGTTPSGLPQRVRGSHVEPASAQPAAVSGPSQRAPEQVFELLARYEAGRRRGMTAAHTEDDAPGESADLHVPEER
ncbi:MAG TPA: ATP-binding protein, partial [Acidimicrobiia bacterium]|nr:ATP-binding protein [Acidimicrobiia bacterium]